METHIDGGSLKQKIHDLPFLGEILEIDNSKPF